MILKNLSVLFLICWIFFPAFSCSRQEKFASTPPVALLNFYNCVVPIVFSPGQMGAGITNIEDLSGENLLLEVEYPAGFITELSLEGPNGLDFVFSYEDLRSQYHVVNAAHCIILPLPAGHPFWSVYQSLQNKGELEWSGQLRYRCAGPEGTVSPVSGAELLSFADCAPADGYCRSQGVSLWAIRLDWHQKEILVEASAPLQFVADLELVLPFVLKLQVDNQLSGSLGIVQIKMSDGFYSRRAELSKDASTLRWNLTALPK